MVIQVKLMFSVNSEASCSVSSFFSKIALFDRSFNKNYNNLQRHSIDNIPSLFHLHSALSGICSTFFSSTQMNA